MRCGTGYVKSCLGLALGLLCCTATACLRLVGPPSCETTQLCPTLVPVESTPSIVLPATQLPPPIPSNSPLVLPVVGTSSALSSSLPSGTATLNSTGASSDISYGPANDTDSGPERADEDAGNVGDAADAADAANAAPAIVPAPSVHYVVPYVAYVGEQQAVIIRGSHFLQGATVLFGSHAAVSAEVKSDTEIYVIPPLIAAPERLSVTVSTPSGTSNADTELVVREHPTYGYTALATGLGYQDRHVLYDAERDAVFSYGSWFSNSASLINRYAYNQADGTWSPTSVYVPDLFDIGMSPDGKSLLALGGSRLWQLDPVTLTSLDYVDFTGGSLGTASQLGVANDGKVLIRDLGLAYSLVDKTFTAVNFPASVGIVFSADGSRAVVGDVNTSIYVPLSIYDASTSLVSPSQTFEDFNVPSLDRTGSRYFTNGKLFDRDLTLVGNVPTLLGHMSTDGLRAYETDSTDKTRIHVYDITGKGPSFAELPEITVPDPIDGYWLHSSLDSRFLLIPGPQTFVVVPLP
jgi:hypothetical protein